MILDYKNNKEVLIMASGKGSNFKAIVNYFRKNKRDDINFKLLVNNPKAKAINLAKKLKIPCIYLKNNQIPDFFKENKFDLVVLAGYLKILDFSTVQTNTFVNIHPSLLPKYKGLHAIKRVYLHREEESGITIHYVNEKLDDGEILYQKKIKISPKWSIRRFEKEIHNLEHYYYPRVIEKILGLNVAVIGQGARENCILEKISASKYLNKLYAINNKSNFKKKIENIEYKDCKNLVEILQKKKVNLVIIGQEKYLEDGIVDILNKNNIKTIGPNKSKARLETSKLYAKKINEKYNIKTSFYKKINNEKNIKKALSYFKHPVIKSDGLTGGKGVFINDDIEKVQNELKEFLKGKYGKASKTSFIEERLYGDEFSLFSFWDGETLLHFPLCRDFKQNDKGQNTGGLASICPIEIKNYQKKKLDKFKDNIFYMIKKEKIKTPFILYSGLIFANDDFYVLEYNIRLGDPECQALLNYISNDWLDIFYNQANKMLDFIELKKSQKKYCLVMAADGYPDDYKTDIEIRNLNKIIRTYPEIKVYLSNVKYKKGKLYSTGGRVLSLVGEDKSLLLEIMRQIKFDEKMYIKL